MVGDRFVEAGAFVLYDEHLEKMSLGQISKPSGVKFVEEPSAPETHLLIQLRLSLDKFLEASLSKLCVPAAQLLDWLLP